MQLLTLSLPISLPAYELPALRGAIIERLGKKHERFHNHSGTGSTTAYHWEYPSVRYTLIKGKASIMAIGDAAMELMQVLIPSLMEQPVMVIAGQPHNVKGFQLKHDSVDLSLHQYEQNFYLYRWIALSKENYDSWKNLESEPKARTMLLDRALTGHLRGMASALAPEIDRESITGSILKVEAIKQIKWHGNTFVAFNVLAKSRVLPPKNMGLGRMVAFGFGAVLEPSLFKQESNVHRKSNITRESL